MLFESLESRVFLSSTLLTDQAAIAAAATALQTAVKNLATQNKAALALISADLKTLPKSNAPLIKTVTSDETKLVAATNADQKSIITPSTALAKKSVTAGTNMINAWTPASQPAVAADASALNAILVNPLGKLQLDLTGPLVADLGTLAANNQSATQLANDITALNTAYAANAAALTSLANNYQASLTTLATDLNAIPNVPNILFNYAGSITEKTGPHPGSSLAFTFDVTVEAADGSWTATFTSKNGAGVAVSQPAQGTLDNTGAFHGNLANGTLITGVVSGKTIKGTAQSSNTNGLFTASHK